MKQGSTLFLKLVILLLGVGVLALLFLVFPSWIMSDKTGMYGPILIGMYIPAIPFFFALYQAFKLLLSIDKNKVFSKESVRALKYIKYSTFTISALYTVGMPYIFQVGDRDDAPGVILITLIFIFGSLVIGTAAAVFQKLLQNVLDIKSENELTV